CPIIRYGRRIRRRQAAFRRSERHDRVNSVRLLTFGNKTTCWPSRHSARRAASIPSATGGKRSIVPSGTPFVTLQHMEITLPTRGLIHTRPQQLVIQLPSVTELARSGPGGLYCEATCGGVFPRVACCAARTRGRDD